MINTFKTVIKTIYYALGVYRVWRPIFRIISEIKEYVFYARIQRERAANGILYQYFQLKNVNLYIEHCLLFSNPYSEEGYINLRGWIANKRRPPLGFTGANKDLRILYDDNNLTIQLNVERQDVLELFPNAQVRCGFDVNLPTQKVVKHIEILQCHKFKDKYIADVAVYNVDDLKKINQYRLLPNITKKKIDNLILNEKERLHKCTKLNSNPLHLYIDPSFHCNLKCPHCHGHKARMAGYHMPNLDENVLDKILNDFGETLVQVYFANWGEPLLNRNFPKFVKKIKTFKIWVHASSNLSLEITDEYLDEIIMSGLDFLIVSVDGITQEVYQKYRKNGDLNLVLSNIKRLVNKKKELKSVTPILEWQILKFPWNRHQIDASYQMALKLGVDKFKCTPGDIHQESTISLSDRTNESPMKMSLDRFLEFEKIYKHKQDNYEYFGCDHLYRHLCIYPDGAAYSCYNVISPEHRIGNLILESKEKIINGKYQISNRNLFRFRGGIRKIGYNPCLNCELIIGNGDHRGHSFSALDFSLAFNVITGLNIYDFIKATEIN